MQYKLYPENKLIVLSEVEEKMDNNEIPVLLPEEYKKDQRFKFYWSERGAVNKELVVVLESMVEKIEYNGQVWFVCPESAIYGTLHKVG